MKKLLKSILFALLVIPCAFMFVACDQLNAEASVNIKGNYKEATAEDLSAFLEENKDTAKFTKGVHMTMTTEYEDTKMYYNFVMSAGEDGKATGIAAEVLVTSGEEKIEARFYADNEYVYYKTIATDGTEATGKIKSNIDASGLDNLLPMGDMTEINSLLTNFASETGIKVEKAKSLGTTKWCVTVEESKIYFVFKGGKLDGVAVVKEGSETNEVSVEAFTKSVEVPKEAKNYEEVTSLSALGALFF